MQSMDQLERELLPEADPNAVIEVGEQVEEQPVEEKQEVDEKRRKLLFYANSFPDEVNISPTPLTRKIMNLSETDLEIAVAQAESWIGTKIDNRTIQEYVYSISEWLNGEDFGTRLANDGFLIGSLKQMTAIQIANMPPMFRSLVLIAIHFVSSTREKNPNLLNLDEMKNNKRKRE